MLAFVDAETIDPLMFSKAYYVGTSDRAAAKPYALLKQALTEAGQIAVTKIAIRSRESLAVLRVHEDTLVLQTCLWPDEVRPAAGVAPETADLTIRPQEMQMARSLMDMLSQDFDLSALHDEYQETLQQVIEAKLQGVELPHEEEAAPTGGKVIDLMAALENSVRAAKKSRGERGAAEETEAEVRTLPVRKTAKKAPAKKAAPARKATGSTAKKAAASPKEAGGKKKTTAATKSTAKATTKKTAAKKTTKRASA